MAMEPVKRYVWFSGAYLRSSGLNIIAAKNTITTNNETRRTRLLPMSTRKTLKKQHNRLTSVMPPICIEQTARTLRRYSMASVDSRSFGSNSLSLKKLPLETLFQSTEETFVSYCSRSGFGGSVDISISLLMKY